MKSCACFVMLKDFENVPDGRLFVSNKGRDRFRVVNVIKEKPVLVCEVRSQGAPLKGFAFRAAACWVTQTAVT